MTTGIGTSALVVAFGFGLLAFGTGCDSEESGTTTGTPGGTSTSSGMGGSGGSGGGGGAGGGSIAPEYAALIRGTLADPATAQANHDMLAMGGEAAAKMAGDFGHDALLGSGLLMTTTQDDFLAIDRWDNSDGMDMFYADPNFQMAFGTLFNPPPTLQTFQHQPDWYGWGDPTSGDAFNPYFFVVVRGRLAGDPVDIKPMHDMIAMQGEMPAQMAGDVAHVVFLGRQDPREFFALDIWSASANLETFYSDPNFQMAFATLFEGGMATLQVYQSTNWYQW